MGERPRIRRCHPAPRRWTQEGFSALDRAFLTELFYGVLRWQRRLDAVIARLRKEETDARTRQVLRLGVYQLWHTRIPQHAAVHETVEIAGRAKPVVNAVLRRFLREEKTLRQELESASPGVRSSHPELLVQRWTRQFGAADAERLCSWNNEPAEIFVRVNELKVSPGELLRSRHRRRSRWPRTRSCFACAAAALLDRVGMLLRAGPEHSPGLRPAGAATRRDGAGCLRRPRRKDDLPRATDAEQRAHPGHGCRRKTPRAAAGKRRAAGGGDRRGAAGGLAGNARGR